jgi:cell division protein FtsQ
MFILIILMAAAMAWGWLMQVRIVRIDVRQAVNADTDEIRELAGVDSGDVMFDLVPGLIADRVARHPWVSGAHITRMPTGKLIIAVREREPVVRVLASSGRPAFYLDAEGFQMHPSGAQSYDVPLLSGYPEEFHPTIPTGDVHLLTFLQALDREKERAGILVSEVVYRQGEVWLQLEPSGNHASTPVRLGSDDFTTKLQRLSAFWTQRVHPGQSRTFELIDLRFSSQIIARESQRE